MKALDGPGTSLDEILRELSGRKTWPTELPEARAFEIMRWARDNYVRCQTRGEPHRTRKLAPPKDLAASEVHTFYSRHFARKSSAGRRFYTAIQSSTPDGRCAFCEHSVADTLDHHLPKSVFSFLCVTPENLIPACGRCNRIFEDSAGDTLAETKWNPYFDRLPSQEPWAQAIVHETEPAAITYRCSVPATWDADLAKRLEFTFQKLNLSRVWAAETNHLVTTEGIALRRLTASRDARAAQLAERWQDYATFNPAGAEAITLRALLDSNWFLDEGYALT